MLALPADDGSPLWPLQVTQGRRPGRPLGSKHLLNQCLNQRELGRSYILPLLGPGGTALSFLHQLGGKTEGVCYLSIGLSTEGTHLAQGLSGSQTKIYRGTSTEFASSQAATSKHCLQSIYGVIIHTLANWSAHSDYIMQSYNGAIFVDSLTLLWRTLFLAASAQINHPTCAHIFYLDQRVLNKKLMGLSWAGNLIYIYIYTFPK